MARSIRVALTLDTRDYTRGLQTATAQTNRFQGQLTGITSRLKSLAGIAAAALGVRELVNYTNIWTDLNSRLRQATGSSEAAKTALDALSVTANRTFTSLEQTAEVFLRNSMTLTELGFSTQAQIGFTDALNNALVISGARGQEAESVQMALSKAFALGTLRGENFNTVLRSGGRVVQALADGLGVTTIELQRMARAGLLDTSTVMNALSSQIETLGSEADAMAATIADAFVILRNNLLAFVGTTNEATGAAATIADAIILLANNLDVLANVLVVVAGLFAGRLLMSLGSFSAGMVSTVAGVKTTATAFSILVKPITRTATLFSSLIALIGRLSRGMIGTKGTTGAFVQFTRVLAMLIPTGLGAAAMLGGLGFAFLEVARFLNNRFNPSVIAAREEMEALLKLTGDSVGNMGIPELESNIASLTADMMALEAEIEAIRQRQNDPLVNPGILLPTGHFTAQVDLIKKQLQIYESALADAKERSREAAEVETAAQQAARKSIEDTIDGLRDQVIMLRMSSVEQEIYTTLKNLSTEATDAERNAIIALINVRHLDNAQQQMSEDATQARIRSLEALDDAIRSSVASHQALLAQTAQTISSNRAIAESYGVQRAVLEEMEQFESARITQLAELSAAMESLTGADRERAEEAYRAQEQLWSDTGELIKGAIQDNAEYQRQFSTGWRQAFADFADAATNEANYARNIFESFTTGMADAMVSFVETGKLSFKGLIQDMLAQVVRFQTNRLVMGLLGMASGTSIGSGIASIFGGARAIGGPVSGGKSYLVGERGPELFTPGSSGQILPNDKLGGGVTNVTYNINAVDARSFKDLVAADPEFIHNVAVYGGRRNM